MKNRCVSIIISIIASLGIAYSLFGIGFLCILTPFATNTIGSSLAGWEDSVYPKEDMAYLAESARSFSIDGTSEDVLRDKIFEIAQKNEPGMNTYSLPETHSLSDNAISHLRDCTPIFKTGAYSVGVVGAITLVLIIFLAMSQGKTGICRVFITGSLILIIIVAFFGLWATFDFNSLFVGMHELLFTGNWTFDYNSLLIQLFPEIFWISMVAAWIGISIILSIILLIVGLLMKRNLRLPK